MSRSTLNQDDVIVIRPARSDDIPQMCGLLADLFAIESDFSPDTGKQARGLKLLLEDRSGRSCVAVAVRKGVVIGMCSVQTVISTSEGGPSGLVEDLVVRRELRGSGIGSALLDHVLTWCKERRITRVQLLADKDNTPAISFYESRGWIGASLICLRTCL